MNVNVVDTPNSAQSRYQRNVSFDNQTP
jgi:hypothetical protein